VGSESRRLCEDSESYSSLLVDGLNFGSGSLYLVDTGRDFRLLDKKEQLRSWQDTTHRETMPRIERKLPASLRASRDRLDRLGMIAVLVALLLYGVGLALLFGLGGHKGRAF
jgi:hypothetical protein